MFRSRCRLIIVLSCLVMLLLVIPGCNQQEKNKLSASTGSIKDAVVPDSSGNKNLNDANNAESMGEQKQEVPEVQFAFYPSGENFINCIIDKRGNIELSDEMRERFNIFARDYSLFYLPEMDYYESFFNADQFAKSFGYNNFGYAVFYVLQYMRCTEKMSDGAVQYAIQSLFVNKDSEDYESNYKDIPHQAYSKLAKYENGYYSLWPEGGLDQNRLFYLLTGLDIKQEGSSIARIRVLAKSYYFNDTSIYEAGENERWIAEKSKKLGISDLEAAAKLISSGEMGELQGDKEIEATIRIKFSGNNPYGYNPRFESCHSRDVDQNKPF